MKRWKQQIAGLIPIPAIAALIVFAFFACDNSTARQAGEVIKCTENSQCDIRCYCNVDSGKCICPDDPLADGDGYDGDAEEDIDYGDGAILGVQTNPIDFGVVQMNQTQDVQVTLINEGNETLEITGVEVVASRAPECAGTRVYEEFELIGNLPSDTTPAIRLMTGKSFTFIASYTPLDPGKDCADLLVASNAANGGLQRIFMFSQEKGDPAIEVVCDCPDEVLSQATDCCAYGKIGVNEQMTIDCHIKHPRYDLSSNAVLIIPWNGITLTDPDGGIVDDFEILQQSIDWDPDDHVLYLSPGNEEVFRVRYHPRDNNIHKANLTVEHNATDGLHAEVTPLDYCLIGVAFLPVLDVQPDPINFGTVPVGDCSLITVYLRSGGGADLDIHSASLREDCPVPDGVFSLTLDPDLDGTENLPTTLPGMGSTEIGLSCCPLGREPYACYVDVLSNDHGLDQNLYSIPVTCTGVRPYCQVLPLTLDFGHLRVGEDNPQVNVKSVIISNNGQASATIQNIYIDGFGFYFLTPINLPLEMAPGAIIEVFIRFDAFSEECISAELHIEYEEGDCDNTVVNLQGCGIQPSIAGPTGCVTWDNTQLPFWVSDPDVEPTQEDIEEWKEIKEVLVENTGTEALVISEIYLKNSSDVFQVVNDFTLPVHIPPNGPWTFKISYLPDFLIDNQNDVIICSNAANSNSNEICQNQGDTAFKICLYGQTINPRLDVLPIEGNMIFNGILTGQSATDHVYVRNMGVGPLRLDEIRIGYGSPAITLENMQPPIPEGGYDLPGQGQETIVLTVKFEPPGLGTHYRGLEIAHNDKAATKFLEDGVTPGTPGSEFPIYLFEIFGTSDENTPPIAISKSPPGYPEGRNGSRFLTVDIGQEFHLDGSASYDLDDGDYITTYHWEADSGVIFTATQDAASSRARIDVPGNYEIRLIVQDSREDPYSSTSDPSRMDARIQVKAIQAPIATAFECDPSYATYITVEGGVQVCFDGSASMDTDGQIVDYRWYVQKVGQPNRINFSVGTAIAYYTFSDIGNYIVTLDVLDNDGNLSLTPAVINVEVFMDETIRVEMNWTEGDADLHWVRPGGSLFSPSSDCSAAYHSQDWRSSGCGMAHHNGASSSGFVPEIVEHGDQTGLNPEGNPCDGTYQLYADYQYPGEKCHTETTCRRIRSCDYCGCDNSFLCWILGVLCLLDLACCATCLDCSPRQVCEDQPTAVTVKLYFGSNISPCILGPVTVAPYSTGLIRSVTRVDGKWICPAR